MGNLCIIPARKGSKRIPNKNSKEFLGKPILLYAIEKAIATGLFEEVMVSTDSEAIAAIAQANGASVPFLRSEKNASDTAPIKDVISEVMEHYPSERFDFACCLFPTTPLLPPEEIAKGLKMIQSGAFDSVRPMLKYEHPIQRAMTLDTTGHVKWKNEKTAFSRTQDLETHFHDAGQFYWFKADQGLTGEKRGGFEISPKYTQDIDTLEDWAVAELKYQVIHLHP